MGTEYFYRRQLPHLTPPGGELFITCRLAGSLPGDVAERLQRERQHIESQTPPELVHDARKRWFGYWDGYLDQVSTESPVWLGQPAIGGPTLDELRGVCAEAGVRVWAAVVMPNHLHAVVKLSDYDAEPFYEVMRRFKGRTARRANEVLGRSGTFWQAETYDHLIRDAAERTRVMRYVLGNPVRAGLVEDWREWPHTFVSEEWVGMQDGQTSASL